MKSIVNNNNFSRFQAVLGGLVIAALVFNLVFWLKTRSTSREFIQKSGDLNSLTAKRINLLQFEREGQKMEVVQSNIRQSFVTKDNVVDFIIFLENTARDTANSIKIRSIAEDSGEPRNLQVELAGSYPKLVNFLAALDNSPYLARPAKIDINQTVGADKEAIFRTQLDLEISPLL